MRAEFERLSRQTAREPRMYPSVYRVSDKSVTAEVALWKTRLAAHRPQFGHGKVLLPFVTETVTETCCHRNFSQRIDSSVDRVEETGGTIASASQSALRFKCDYSVPSMPRLIVHPVAVRLVTRTEALSADRLEQHGGLASNTLQDRQPERTPRPRQKSTDQ
jgi:hypothetical protein